MANKRELKWSLGPCAVIYVICVLLFISILQLQVQIDIYFFSLAWMGPKCVMGEGGPNVTQVNCRRANRALDNAEKGALKTIATWCRWEIEQPESWMHLIAHTLKMQWTQKNNLNFQYCLEPRTHTQTHTASTFRVWNKLAFLYLSLRLVNYFSKSLESQVQSQRETTLQSVCAAIKKYLGSFWA